LGNGEHLGIRIEYAAQESPRGIAEAFSIGAEFIGSERTCLVLGDNILYANDLRQLLRNVVSMDHGAAIFAYPVHDPERYGVVEFDSDGKPIDIVEKPKDGRSRYAIPGIYFFEPGVTAIAKKLRPSSRGELEITDVIKAYLSENSLHVERLGRGVAWLDAGTHDALLDASSFIHTIERRQGLKVACIEEIAWRMGFITTDQLLRLGESGKSGIDSQYASWIVAGGEDGRK
jgi:glucose-1-phosphate thymidylyltransferase